jgi:hypothetical protein
VNRRFLFAIAATFVGWGLGAGVALTGSVCRSSCPQPAPGEFCAAICVLGHPRWRIILGVLIGAVVTFGAFWLVKRSTRQQS